MDRVAVASDLGLRDTAYIYGVALIVLAAVALALSHQLEDPQSAPAAEAADRPARGGAVEPAALEPAAP